MTVVRSHVCLHPVSFNIYFFISFTMIEQSASPCPVVSLVESSGHVMYLFMEHDRHDVLNGVLIVSLQKRSSYICEVQDTTKVASNTCGNILYLHVWN